MGKPDPQTDRSASERTKNESSQPLGKAPSREEDFQEPSELSEATMSNKKPPQVDQKNPEPETENEEDEGFFSLEAKAGLSLICILACGFSFMVWQQWKHQESGQVAVSEDKKPTGKDETSDTPKPKSSAEAKPSKTTVANGKPLKEDPFSDQFEPEVNSTKVPAKEISLSQPSQNDAPFGPPDSKQKPQKANIPTLELPQESPAKIAILPTENKESIRKEKPDPFDPFGPEMNVAESKTDSPEKEKPAELPSLDDDPFSAKEKKTAAAEIANSDAPTLKTEDPLATGHDPFANEPAQDINETSFADATNGNKPQSTDSDPFAEPAAKQPAIIPSDGDQKVASGTESFQDPLPILEPVPTKDEPTKASKNPFGEFESVQAGSAQASSVTSVAPEFPKSQPRKGTLAELDTQAKTTENSNPLLLNDDRFSEPTVSAERESKPFHLQEDGTYEIQAGDSYWNISRNAYGSPLYYRALAEFNTTSIPNPENMEEGVRIQIPPTAELERRYPRLLATKQIPGNSNIVKTSAESDQEFFNDESGTPIYRVRKNDTLTGIAQKYLGRASRWIQIYELNRQTLADPNKLKIGTLLKLPRDASRVKMVGE